MITLYHSRDKSFLIPENFNELSKNQLIRLTPILYEGGNSDLVKLKCLQILLNVPKLKYYFLSTEIKIACFDHIEWLFKKNTLTDQKLTSHKKFYGPKKEFDNLILKEFHEAEGHYDQYVHGDDKEMALNCLIACLYRKAKPNYNKKINRDGDVREPFNVNTIEYNASRYISKWDKNVKLSILHWYDGCRQNIIELYDKVFSASKEGSSQSSESGLFDFIRTLADGGKYGVFEKVEMLNLHTALHEMEKTIIEGEELKSLYQNSN